MKRVLLLAVGVTVALALPWFIYPPVASDIVAFAHPFSAVVLGSVLSGAAVGPALLEARRHFVRLGNPLGLAYTHYGPATARYCPPGLTATDPVDPCPSG